MSSGPVRGVFGLFGAAGGESIGHRIQSMEVNWCDGWSPATWAVELDATALDLEPSIGSTHAQHFLRGGQDGINEKVEFSRLWPENSDLSTDKRGFSTLTVRGTDIRGKWKEQGTVDMVVNCEVWGEKPRPGAQTAGSHNQNPRYPNRDWRSFETLLRYLFLRLNVSPGLLHYDGSLGMLDLANLTVRSRQDGTSTPILHDCPPFEWKKTPVENALQQLLDAYNLIPRVTKDGQVGLRRFEQASLSLSSTVGSVRAIGGTVQTLGSSTNYDPFADATVILGDPIVIEDPGLACEFVIRDPHPKRKGCYVSLERAESLAAVGINIPGAGFAAQSPTNRPDINAKGLEVIRCWARLRMQNPPFSEIHDPRLHSIAMEAFQLLRIKQAREEVSDPDTGNIVDIDITSEGTSFAFPYRVPTKTRLKFDGSQSGQLDPGAAGQTIFQPRATTTSAEPWRWFPLIASRAHEIDSGGLAPDRLLVKNAITPNVTAKNAGSTSSQVRDIGPYVSNPQPSETHEDAEEWPLRPRIIDKWEGIIDAGKPILGHDGEMDGDRSKLCSSLDWSKYKGITADIHEIAENWGKALVWWNGCYECRAYRDPLRDRTSTRSFAPGQIWLDGGNAAAFPILDLPEVPTTGRSPAKGYSQAKTIEAHGVQLRCEADRTTVSFEEDGPGELGGTATFHDLDMVGGTTGPGTFSPVTRAHYDEVWHRLFGIQDQIYDRLEDFRSTDDAIGGMIATIDGWRIEAVPGSLASWPLDRATFRVDGEGHCYTSIAANARGPREDFDDNQEIENAIRLGGGSGGGGGGGYGGDSRIVGTRSSMSSQPTERQGEGQTDHLVRQPIAGVDSPTLPLADGRPPESRKQTGGRVNEHLGEVCAVDLPSGRFVWKGYRHSHWARAWIPGDHSELLIDKFHHEDGTLDAAMMEGLYPLIKTAQDQYNRDTRYTGGTVCKASTQLPIRNVKLLYDPDDDEAEPDVHADYAWKCYVFFDHPTLSASDDEGDHGGRLRKRKGGWPATNEEAADGSRHALEIGETEVHTDDQGEEGEGEAAAVDEGQNWAFVLLADDEDWSMKASGSRHWRLGKGKRTHTGYSDDENAVTVDNGEDWNKLVVAGTTSQSCQDYCGIDDFNKEILGFTEDMDGYSYKLAIASLIDHVEHLYKYIGYVPAIMAWSYAHTVAGLLAKVVCCICDTPVDETEEPALASIQECLCAEGEVPIRVAICNAICDEDCDGSPTTKPDCCPADGEV